MSSKKGCIPGIRGRHPWSESCESCAALHTGHYMLLPECVAGEEGRRMARVFLLHEGLCLWGYLLSRTLSRSLRPYSTAHTHSCTQTEFKVVPNTKHVLQPKLLGTLFCLVLLFCPYDVEEREAWRKNFKWAQDVTEIRPETWLSATALTLQHRGFSLIGLC